jgi:hypothetical protein
MAMITFMMEASRTSETSVCSERTRRYITEGCHLHTYLLLSIFLFSQMRLCSHDSRLPVLVTYLQLCLPWQCDVTDTAILAPHYIGNLYFYLWRPTCFSFSSFLFLFNTQRALPFFDLSTVEPLQAATREPCTVVGRRCHGVGSLVGRRLLQGSGCLSATDHVNNILKIWQSKVLCRFLCCLKPAANSEHCLSFQLFLQGDDIDEMDRECSTHGIWLTYLLCGATVLVEHFPPHIFYVRFLDSKFLQGGIVSPTRNPQPGGPGYLLVWHLPPNLSGMGGPTSSYATAGIALEFIVAHKPLHPATECFRQGWDTIEGDGRWHVYEILVITSQGKIQPRRSGRYVWNGDIKMDFEINGDSGPWLNSSGAG